MTNIAENVECKNDNASLVALCVGFFMVMLDITVVNVSLPSIARGLSANISDLQWVVDGYTLTFACFLLSAGNFGDCIGAKKVFLFGLSLFILASLACFISYSIFLLIGFRLLQGVGAALVMPTSLALINVSYQNKSQRAKAIGIWGAMGGIAAASGPILGAMLTTWFGWRAIFFINIPVGIVGIALTYKYVHDFKINFNNRFDFLGQTMGVVTIAVIAYYLIESGRAGWLEPSLIIVLFVFVLSFIAFLLIERHSIFPMFPLSFFHSKIFSVSILIGMLLNIAFYGELFTLPLYFEKLKEYSTFMTGLAIFPQLAFVAISSYLGGKMTSITGPRLPMKIGLIIGVIGFFGMWVALEYFVSPPYLVLIFPLTIIGFGTAFTMPAATVAVMNSIPNEKAGIASGAFNASRQIGSLLGVAIFGSILNRVTYFLDGMQLTLMIEGFVFLFGVLVIVIFRKAFLN